LALAQGGPGKTTESGAAASKRGAVGGVVVKAPQRRNRIPPDKKSALDAEAAKHEAWRKYRAATPAPTPTTAAPGSTPASARTENYPGLHSLGSQ
jgi:hypothetical protein